jgi:hypothetical protein
VPETASIQDKILAREPLERLVSIQHGPGDLLASHITALRTAGEFRQEKTWRRADFLGHSSDDRLLSQFADREILDIRRVESSALQIILCPGGSDTTLRSVIGPSSEVTDACATVRVPQGCNGAAANLNYRSCLRPEVATSGRFETIKLHRRPGLPIQVYNIFVNLDHINLTNNNSVYR